MTGMPRRDVYASLCGGGPKIAAIAGAAAAIDAKAKVIGWAGVSAGSLVAAGKAFHVEDAVILGAIQQALSSGGMLRPDPSSVAFGGVIDWDVIGRYVDKVIGSGKRMGDAKTELAIGVTSLDDEDQWLLTTIQHPHVKVREAVMASCAFMAGLTPACAIPSLGTALSPDVRLFVDGGYVDNTMDAVWDGRDAPRVSVCLDDRDDTKVNRVRRGDVAGIHAAVVRSGLRAASKRKSKRTDGLDVDVAAPGGWSFSRSPLAVEAEWRNGYDAVAARSPWFRGGL